MRFRQRHERGKSYSSRAKKSGARTEHDGECAGRTRDVLLAAEAIDID